MDATEFTQKATMPLLDQKQQQEHHHAGARSLSVDAFPFNSPLPSGNNDAPPSLAISPEEGGERYSSSLHSCDDFFTSFFKEKGTITILVVSILMSFSIGAVMGVVPDVVANRYAQIYYGYSGSNCADFERSQKPEACQNGADMAQQAVADANLALNLLTLVFNPVVGSLSDIQGRRPFVLLSVCLFLLGPVCFVLIQLVPWLNPNIYYAAYSLTGMVDFLSITFAAISDCIPEQMRAAGYGVVLAGYYGGFTFSPSLTLFMSHLHVSFLSFACALLALVVAVLALPETLPESMAIANQLTESQLDDNSLRSRTNSGSSYSDDASELFVSSDDQQQPSDQQHFLISIGHIALRPLRDLFILTRGQNLRLLAAGSFFSSMVYSCDTTLVIYYIEDQLNVRDKDLAKMFIIFGTIGILMQAFFLQPMLRQVGEKRLLVLAFISGTCHNALYGLARTKLMILLAICLSQFTKVNFPLLSSFASFEVSAYEQGRIQGALFALNALAKASGPMLLEIVYNKTKDSHPGLMFIIASALYGVGTVLVSFLPKPIEAEAAIETTESEVFNTERRRDDDEDCITPTTLASEEPLLNDSWISESIESQR